MLTKAYCEILKQHHGAALGVVAGLGAFTFVYAKGASYLTTDAASCANCHIMEEHYSAWLKSSHRNVAKCADCHMPHDALGKYAAKASNGFWHSLAFTTGRFPDPLQIKAHNRAITERTCRDCHDAIVDQIDARGFEPIEAAAAASTPDEGRLSTDDRAALLAIAGGAKLHEHLLTGRLSVTASSGTRIPYPQMQQLERAGLTVRDTSHPVHAGQPVSLTDAGRAALLDARRTPATHAPTSPARPGAPPTNPSLGERRSAGSAASTAGVAAPAWPGGDAHVVSSTARRGSRPFPQRVEKLVDRVGGQTRRCR